VSLGRAGEGEGAEKDERRHERYLYAATIAQSASDPDFVAVIGADPREPNFGRIVNRIDMPNVGDELHHFGYSFDQKRLIVPGLFSNRIHVFEIGRDLRSMRLRAVNDQLVQRGGYIIPHSVIAESPGRVLITMIGAATGSTQPGGIVRVNDATGAFEGYFGPGPVRAPDALGPEYMYDFDSRAEANRGISTTFGPPALCGGGIDPACLGGTVAVWNLRRQRVIQVASLGAHSGALEVRFIDRPGVRRAFINTPGTSAVWLAHDDDRDGVFEFTQVLGPGDGLVLPVDMLLSYDGRFMYLSNWFGNTVQQFDITDPFHPVLTGTVSVPHPNMLRLSPDNERLYVSNSLLTPWDNDPRFGPPRNNDYGIWLFDVDRRSGRMTPYTADGRAWVSFTGVQKRTTVGPAGPHMMFFDPSIRLARGEH
jgi:selenium-binding protein 1